MIQITMNDIVQDLLKESINKRVCSLIYSLKSGEIKIGTGNLIEIAQKKFIVTCSHVVNEFFLGIDSHCLLYNGNKIVYDKLKLKGELKTLDIALIEILDDSLVRDFHTTSDIEIIENFNDYDFSHRNLFILGYPAEYVTTVDSKVHSFCFLTTEHKQRSQSSDFLYLYYPKSTDLIQTNHSSGDLPAPGGLSGSFIFKLDNPKQNGLLDQVSAKIIAVQIASDYKSFLKATNIKHLDKLIKTKI